MNSPCRTDRGTYVCASQQRRRAGFRLALLASVVVTARGESAWAHGSRLVPVEDRPIVEDASHVRKKVPSPQVAPTAPRPWGGVYLGADVAYALASASASARAASGEGPASTSSIHTPFGGVHIGYNYVLPRNLVVGGVADVAFPYFAEDGIVSSPTTGQGATTQKLDFVSTVRSRIGYAKGPAFVYGTFGLAFGQERFTNMANLTGSGMSALRMAAGGVLGIGAELRVAPRWTAGVEYLFEHLGAASASLAGSDTQADAINTHMLALRLHRYFGGDGGAPSAATETDESALGSRFNAHAQATFIEQGYFSFRSPYAGPNSLSGATQFRNTLSATAFLGARAWKGAEIYFNPEVDQGFGLSETLGIAAFPNGEAQKAAYPVPRLNIDRLMLRQTFDLGGEAASVPDGPNQLEGTHDVSRITVTVGRMTVGDGFGLNAYATDPRTQFLNWNVYGGGSYDWTMDKPGFTWGAWGEWNTKNWALRLGYFLEPTMSNGNSFDINIPTHGQYLAEPELRYALFGRPGRFRLLAWLTRANMGSYAEAVAGMGGAGGAPDIAATRSVRETWGGVANFEQALSADVGLFSRASWTPGLVEVMGWTDCDESLSLGTQVVGAAFGRPNDLFGVAGVVEGLSPAARRYFEAGGMGIVIGDGRLNYRSEAALEAYYAVFLAAGTTLTFDYQVIANPGYNADRGPVPIYAARVHTEL